MIDFKELEAELDECLVLLKKEDLTAEETEIRDRILLAVMVLWASGYKAPSKKITEKMRKIIFA